MPPYNVMVKRWAHMFALVVAGEVVFSLPFQTARYFRPTILEAFSLSNSQLGDLFAFYGITAMASYFLGGPLADRFSARTLLSMSLFATAAGGLYMASYPSWAGMAFLYSYWGVTSILLFWAALIKATRDWGGERRQGIAFGVLDAGRGAVAALLAVGASLLLASLLPEDVAGMGDAERRSGFRQVVLFYSAMTALAGVVTWVLVPAGSRSSSGPPIAMFTGLKQVLARPLSWALAGVIIAAYCGYKGLDNYSLYAHQVLGMDEVEAAQFVAWSTWLRPAGALAAGLLADRFTASRTLAGAFAVLILCYGALALAEPPAGGSAWVMANLLLSFFAVFALRGIYFAMVQEIRTPQHLTGRMVGVVSFVGYTPEVFFGPVTGRILDAAPGLPGLQHYFFFLAGAALAGLVVTSLVLLHPQRRAA